jgi:sugar phosphate permease
MFILEGIPPIIWAFFWMKLADNKPRDAKWLTESEKNDIETVMEEEQKGIKPVKNYKEAFKSPTVIILSFQYFFWSIGVYGFVMWLPSILKAGSSIGIVAAGWLSSVPYALAIILMLTASHFSDRTGNRKTFVWAFLLIGTIAFYGSYLIGTSNFWLSFVLLVIAGGVMYAPYGPFFAIIPELLPKNVAGGATALVNSMGALGSFVGSYVVGYLNSATGSINASYIFMAGSLLASVILTIIVKTPATSKENIIKEAL